MVYSIPNTAIESSSTKNILESSIYTLADYVPYFSFPDLWYILDFDPACPVETCK